MPELFVADGNDIIDALFELGRLLLGWQDKDGKPLPANFVWTGPGMRTGKKITIGEVLSDMGLPPWYGECNLETWTGGKLSNKLCLTAAISRFLPRCLSFLLGIFEKNTPWYIGRGDWAQKGADLMKKMLD